MNIPPDQAGRVQSLTGQEIELNVGPEPKVVDYPKGEHPVYRLITFAGEPGERATSGGPRHKPPHPSPGQSPGQPIEVTGTVERLNYAKHGEANGVVLDTGDFVHLKPDGMKKVGLRVGDQVAAKGRGKSFLAGTRAIDAEIVNGIALGPKKPR